MDLHIQILIRNKGKLYRDQIYVGDFTEEQIKQMKLPRLEYGDVFAPDSDGISIWGTCGLTKDEYDNYNKQRELHQP